MADYRTKRQKLEAMANQTESPHEAEVARKKLAAMGEPKYGEKVRPSSSGPWGESFWNSPMMRQWMDDILRDLDQRAWRQSAYWSRFYGNATRQAKPSGYERQGARAEYLYEDDILTEEDLVRARDSMAGGPPPMSKEEADRQAEAMYQEIRRRQETERMDRDAWRKAYRTPWGYEDKESDDE